MADELAGKPAKKKIAVSEGGFFYNIVKTIRKYIWGLLSIFSILLVVTTFFLATSYRGVGEKFGHAVSHSYIRAFSDHNFLVSLSASFLEDLFSFLIITIFLTIITAINAPDPKSEDIFTRVSYLLNGKNIKNRPDVINYMKGLLKENTLYSPEYEYNITYTEYIEELNSYKIYVRMKRTMINMLDDDIYTDRNFPYKIFTDGVVDGSGIQGEILSAKIIKHDGGEAEKYYGPQKIKESIVSIEQELTIERSSSVVSEFSFWIYHKIGEKYKIDPQKYTHKLTAYVRNDTEQVLHITCHRDGEYASIQPRMAKPYILDNMKPEPVDLFTLLKSKPDEGENG